MHWTTLLAEQGGVLDGALKGAAQGAIVGAIAGALVSVAMCVKRYFGKSGKQQGGDKKESGEPPA